MKYSIIITYYQGYNILCTALELLHKSLKTRKDVEIIVVNDNPQTSIHKIENLDPFQRLRVVDMEKNGGYSFVAYLYYTTYLTSVGYFSIKSFLSCAIY